MKSVAQIISLIFGPLILIPILLYMIIVHVSLSALQTIIIIPIMITATLIIPFGYILLAYKKNKIKDLDITNRKERYLPFLITTISLFINLIILNITNIKLMFDIYVLFLILITINGLITLFWKISLHMAINIIFIMFAIYYYGLSASYFLILIPLIYWSRLYLKKHTVMQLLISLILNGAITYIFLFSSLPIKHFFNLR